LPRPVPSGPPLPSRAVLAIGALALTCLALLAALALEAAEREAPLALDGPSSLEGPPGAAAALAAPRPPAPAPGAVYPDEPEPIPAGLLAVLEQAAEEPLDVELARLLEALLHGFGESSVQVEPTLRPYAFRLAGRLNVRGGAYVVRVAAPDPALAEARAETLGRLFEAAGVVPGRLRVVARRGVPALTAEPA
jgi:hypothetical protein